MNLTIDTFAWIEILRDTTRGRAAARRIESAERSLTPSVVLAEFASACRRDGLSDDTILGELAAIQEASDIVPIDTSIALGAAHVLTELRDFSRKRKIGLPGLVDSVVLATARRERTSLLTGDPHFEAFPETVWIG